MGLNVVAVRGNLTKNPEIRYTPNGTPVCSFSIAINRKWRSNDELKEEVCYVDIVCFGKAAETHAQHLQKGTGVCVEGRLQQRRWETDDGQKRSKHEIVAIQVDYLSKANNGSGDEAGDGDEGQ